MSSTLEAALVDFAVPRMVAAAGFMLKQENMNARDIAVTAVGTMARWAAMKRRNPSAESHTTKRSIPGTGTLEIAAGGERFERGGKSIFQSLCVQLARMGCIVWQWDMLSDSDSKQFSPELVHRFAKQRPEMNTTENWGLYSPQAESHLQSIMGLQTLNAVRSLDFVLSLPEVDAESVWPVTVADPPGRPLLGGR